MSIPFFRVPLNLPHAGTLAARLAYHVNRVCSIRPQLHQGERLALLLKAQDLAGFLKPFQIEGENPPTEEAAKAVEEAARQARAIVDDIHRMDVGDDRLGQAVRNLFECLGLGEEGARISLRAGENPDSALRPQ